MTHEILHEITPLAPSDCFTMFTRTKSSFTFPLHYHDEIELNFIENGKGSKRVVGDHWAEIDDIELALIGSNLQHGWFTHHCQSQEILEITIQFHKDLFSDSLLHRNQLASIRTLFENAHRGVLFSAETTRAVAPQLKTLQLKGGFDSVLELMSILHFLSKSKEYKLLSSALFNNPPMAIKSRRIERTYEYISQNFHKQISLSDVAEIAGMTNVAFCRFFKAKTGYSFVDALNDVRIGNAARMLINTTHSIAEIAYQSGFKNISNFNRTFKQRKGCSPGQFREEYSDKNRIFI
jgi:AraC-like DNA-binding protein